MARAPQAANTTHRRAVSFQAIHSAKALCFSLFADRLLCTPMHAHHKGSKPRHGQSAMIAALPSSLLILKLAFTLRTCVNVRMRIRMRVRKVQSLPSLGAAGKLFDI